MKRGAIAIIVLLLILPISIAEEVIIPESYETNVLDKSLTQETNVYFYAGSNLIASKDNNGEIKYYHSDRLGSNRLTTDEQGNVKEKFKSLPFGQQIENTGIKHSFTGKELDKSDLYYFGARYYDSDLGRFTSVDPVEDNHPYTYVSNDPMNYVDPSGTDFFSTASSDATTVDPEYYNRLEDTWIEEDPYAGYVEYGRTSGGEVISLGSAGNAAGVGLLESPEFMIATLGLSAEVPSFSNAFRKARSTFKSLFDNTAELLFPETQTLALEGAGPITLSTRQAPTFRVPVVNLAEDVTGAKGGENVEVGIRLTKGFRKQLRKLRSESEKINKRIEEEVKKLESNKNHRISSSKEYHFRVDSGSRIFARYNQETQELEIIEYMPSSKHPPRGKWKMKVGNR